MNSLGMGAVLARRVARPLDPVEKSQHRRQYRCLSQIFQVQQVTNPVDGDALRVAAMALQPGDVVIGHHGAQPALPAQEQDRAREPG